MSADGSREQQFTEKALYDLTPLPDSVPKVDEIGASSAPLMSAAFFVGARCRAFNDDYMKCKDVNPGRGQVECMREGRKVTRCAASVLADINKNCLNEFRSHWECLEQNNQQLWQCRRPERALNDCVFSKLSLKKEIPGTPAGTTPVHLRDTQIYAHYERGPLSQGPPAKPQQ